MTDHEIWLNTYGDKRWRLEHLYKIRDKDAKIVNMVLNPVQEKFFKERTGMDYILKARQMGFSTFCLLDDLDDTLTIPNFTVFIMVDEHKNIEPLFQICHFAYQQFPDKIRGCDGNVINKPAAKYETKNELYFKDINSRIAVGLKAKSQTINKLHVSEYAYVKDADQTMTTTTETVPKSGSIVLETTPNGLNHAYDKWQLSCGYVPQPRGVEKLYKPHFYPWYIFPEYALPLTAEEYVEYGTGSYYTQEEASLVKVNELKPEQIKWRRWKKADLGDMFPEKYPESDIDCFLSSGNPYFDMAALKEQLNAIEV